MLRILLLAACLLAGSAAWAQVPDHPLLRETIRRKAEEAAVSDCQIGGLRVCARKEVLEFFERRAFAPAWGQARRREQLLQTLHNAPYEALEPADYYYGTLLGLHQRFPSLLLEERANLEVLFTDALLLFAGHRLGGKVNPATADPEWHVGRQPAHLPERLERALEADSLLHVLDELAPSDPAYLRLRKAAMRYEALFRQGPWPVVRPDSLLEVGVADSAVLALRKRLFLTQDLPAGLSNGLAFDSLLAEAVKRFQRRHGLEPDGKVGPQTLEALNVPLEARIMQLRINMERWRWLPRTFAPYRLEANIPDFTLRVLRNGQELAKHAIIVGKEYRQTPAFSATMKYLVLNPTWTVPPGILNNDVLPALKKNRNYLAEKGLKAYDAAGKEVDPQSADWDPAKARTYTYRQAPGPDNALGAVKFIFPNPFFVYFHDTPSRHLFARQERTFSSGCVRVERPLDLAALLLRGQEGWGREEIDRAVAKQTTQHVPLAEQPEVYVLYFTAWVEADGTVHFRKDVYQRDAALQTALLQLRPE